MAELIALTKKQLTEKLASHKKWLADYKKGNCAKFTNTDLRFAEFEGVDLSHVVFRHVDMSHATFKNVIFDSNTFDDVTAIYATFENCTFKNIDFNSGCDFTQSIFRKITFTDSIYCSRASMYGATFTDVDFGEMRCYGTDFRNANIYNCKLDNILTDENTAGLNLACPEKGAFIGYKHAVLHNGDNCVVELEIPADALRSSSTTRKCRASKAKVISITKNDGTPINNRIAYSTYTPSFKYKVGETVQVKNFDKNRWSECAPGIHFFITRREAELYR